MSIDDSTSESGYRLRKDRYRQDNGLLDSSIGPGSVKKFASKRVIIVEDVKELLGLYTKAVELHGHKVVLSSDNGRTVIEAARRGDLDDAQFAILDYRMEKMNGLEVAKKLLEVKPTIRIIIASADQSIANEVRQVGFHFLRKPFRITELMALLSEI